MPRRQAARQPDQESKAEGAQGKTVTVEPELAKLVTGSIVRTIPVSKDSMILSYLPAWDHGNVDNIGFGNNDGGNRMLIDWSPPSLRMKPLCPIIAL